MGDAASPSIATLSGVLATASSALVESAEATCQYSASGSNESAVAGKQTVEHLGSFVHSFQELSRLVSSTLAEGGLSSAAAAVAAAATAPGNSSVDITGAAGGGDGEGTGVVCRKVEASQATLERLMYALEDHIDSLQGAMDDYSPPDLPGGTAASAAIGPATSAPADEALERVRRTLRYAHRLSYSTHAPPGYQMGMPLGPYKPPAPQEWQMRFSQLHEYAAKHGARFDGQGAAAGQQQQQAAAAALEDPASAVLAALAGLGLQLPPGFHPPPPPPGWQPGQAVVFPAPLVEQLRQMVAVAGAAAVAGTPAQVQPAAAAPPPLPVPAAPAAAPARDYGLVLNETVELASESEEDSDEDDDDDFSDM